VAVIGKNPYRQAGVIPQESPEILQKRREALKLQGLHATIIDTQKVKTKVSGRT